MSLDIIIGSMFSGKTTEIVKYYNNYSILYNVIVINHTSDNRYSDNSVVCTHNGSQIPAYKLDMLSNLDKKIYENSQFILIDESQFFTDLYEFVIKALSDNKNILIVGLNGDINCKPFNNILNLIPHADNVKHLTSLCHKCRKPTKAFMHYRINKKIKDKISVGGIHEYMVLCRNHYNLQIKIE